MGPTLKVPRVTRSLRQIYDVEKYNDDLWETIDITKLISMNYVYGMDHIEIICEVGGDNFEVFFLRIEHFGDFMWALHTRNIKYTYAAYGNDLLLSFRDND